MQESQKCSFQWTSKICAIGMGDINCFIVRFESRTRIVGPKFQKKKFMKIWEIWTIINTKIFSFTRLDLFSQGCNISPLQILRGRKYQGSCTCFRLCIPVNLWIFSISTSSADGFKGKCHSSMLLMSIEDYFSVPSCIPCSIITNICALRLSVIIQNI